MRVVYQLLLWVFVFCRYTTQEESCRDDLGMGSKGIPDESITASSSNSADKSPQFARLDGKNAWCSAPKDKLPYIQIKLVNSKSITGITTQGSYSDWAWVTKYEVEYLEKGTWKHYHKEFEGNNNVNGLKSNTLDPPIRTQSIRIYPKDPVMLNGTDPKPCCLRLELYGCSAPGSTCDQPTSPHGSVITHPTRREKYQNGQVILFGCKQGFYLDGMPIITCNGNKWTQTQFRCLGFCPEVGNILNGKVSHVTPQVGKAAIEFRCANNSFQLIGKTRLECIDGQWNGKLPYCQKLPSCVRLQSPANGTLHGNDNSHGAEANFTCFTGFDLFGASALTCNKGVWSSQVPTCKANCTKIMNLPNGHVFGTRFSHGQVVSFNCKYGYELVGDRSLRCINGRWNSSVPQCKVMPCVKPSIPSNSRIIYPRTDQVRYTHGTTLYLACHEGHLLTGSPIMECNYTTWLKREFKCIAKSCGRPQIPLHGNIKSHVFTFRSKVYFECNPGFKLVGDKYRQCQANQTWSGRASICKPIDCGRLSTPHKVLIVSETGHTRFGGYVKYRCKEKSYELIGSETRVCQNDEQWSGVEPSCQIINCGNPDTPANVKQVSITNGFNYGSSVEFACEANYTLEGSKIITCGETKEWSSSAPSCLAPCLEPGEPGNGIRIGDDFTHGKFIKFQCDGDFEHVGEKTIQCLDGKWSHKIPQCKGKRRIK